MTFKEFSDWCNERACDGCWGMQTAMYCYEIVSNIYKLPRRHRERSWQEINERDNIVEYIVKPINQKIAEMIGDINATL